MLRRLFLSLSRWKALRRWMETSPTAAHLNRRFIAGPALADALSVAAELHSRGIQTTLDHLGENVSTGVEARYAAQTALQALRQAAALRAGVTVSIKLTQFGLDLSSDLAIENVQPLVDLARDLNSRVEFDMESSLYTDPTLAIVKRMAGRGPVRAVIQSYLYRSAQDIRELNALAIPVRLCKGAYKEPETVAWQRKTDVDESYRSLAALLLADGAYPAFATHDPRMIRFVLDNQPDPSRFEFQMLHGIRRDLQSRLVADGWKLRLYVPYGEAWYPYFMRRIAERPANLLFAVRSLFG